VFLSPNLQKVFKQVWKPDKPWPGSPFSVIWFFETRPGDQETHGVRKVTHGVRKVTDGVRKVTYDVRKVYCVHRRSGLFKGFPKTYHT
jgi:hypothetical protein